jgi:hypothetical protein
MNRQIYENAFFFVQLLKRQFLYGRTQREFMWQKYYSLNFFAQYESRKVTLILLLKMTQMMHIKSVELWLYTFLTLLGGECWNLLTGRFAHRWTTFCVYRIGSQLGPRHSLKAGTKRTFCVLLDTLVVNVLKLQKGIFCLLPNMSIVVKKDSTCTVFRSRISREMFRIW